MKKNIKMAYITLQWGKYGFYTVLPPFWRDITVWDSKSLFRNHFYIIENIYLKKLEL
jgi:hypothetical protein